MSNNMLRNLYDQKHLLLTILSFTVEKTYELKKKSRDDISNYKTNVVLVLSIITDYRFELIAVQTRDDYGRRVAHGHPEFLELREVGRAAHRLGRPTLDAVAGHVPDVALDRLAERQQHGHVAGPVAQAGVAAHDDDRGPGAAQLEARVHRVRVRVVRGRRAARHVEQPTGEQHLEAAAEPLDPRRRRRVRRDRVDVRARGQRHALHAEHVGRAAHGQRGVHDHAVGEVPAAVVALRVEPQARLVHACDAAPAHRQRGAAGRDAGQRLRGRRHRVGRVRERGAGRVQHQARVERHRQRARGARGRRPGHACHAAVRALRHRARHARAPGRRAVHEHAHVAAGVEPGAGHGQRGTAAHRPARRARHARHRRPVHVERVRGLDHKADGGGRRFRSRRRRHEPQPHRARRDRRHRPTRRQPAGEHVGHAVVTVGQQQPDVRAPFSGHRYFPHEEALGQRGQVLHAHRHRGRGRLVPGDSRRLERHHRDVPVAPRPHVRGPRQPAAVNSVAAGVLQVLRVHVDQLHRRLHRAHVGGRTRL